MKTADAIVALRRALRLTQPDFARKVGASASSIAHYENGTRGPDAATLVRLCRAAHEAKLLNLAEALAARVPGIEDGFFIPCWRIAAPAEPQPQAEEPAAPPAAEAPPLRPRAAAARSKREPQYIMVEVAQSDRTPLIFEVHDTIDEKTGQVIHHVGGRHVVTT